jgi:hypothetical protein
MRLLKRFLLAVGALLLLVQLVPATRDNPPATGELVADPAVLQVLRRACYDCHSNATVWPWYAYVQPAAWLVARDVEVGRRELNFSHWATLTQAKHQSLADSCVDEIESGSMPPRQYLLTHGEAVVTAAELVLLRQWAAGYAPKPEPQPAVAATVPQSPLGDAVLEVFERRCGSCHGDQTDAAGKAKKAWKRFGIVDRLDELRRTPKFVDLQTPLQSELWLRVFGADADMPVDEDGDFHPLPEAELDVVRRWLEAGAPLGTR